MDNVQELGEAMEKTFAWPHRYSGKLFGASRGEDETMLKLC